MISENYQIAMSETLHYLKGIREEDIKKIPDKFMAFLKENSSKDYACNFDYTKPLKELKLKKETRGIISSICLTYWCTTQEQKTEFIKHLKTNEKNHQEQLRKKYNPDNIFASQERPVANSNTTLALQPIKESIFGRIRKWFKSFFQK